MKLRTFLPAVLAATTFIFGNAQARVWFHYSTVEQNIMLQTWQLNQSLGQYAGKELPIGEFFTLVSQIPYLNDVTVSRKDDTLQSQVNLKVLTDFKNKYCSEDKDIISHGCLNVLVALQIRELLAQNDFAQYYDFPNVYRQAQAKKEQKTLNLFRGLEVGTFADFYITQADLNRLPIAQFLQQNYKLTLVPNPNAKAPTASE